ncbi:MAG TPA: hypothetical protein VMT22_10515 [Terriglobales bacterium]|jgi:hypothetical protein|nr:hypothetical protein [Terriglobales bacterium]
MKTFVKMLALVFLVGFLGSSCATVDRLNTEYEEETARVERMTPEEKAEWEKAQHEEFKIEMRGFYDDGD